MLKTELHAHTSADPHDYIPYSTTEFIDRAASLEYNALAITLHDRWFDARSVAEYARTRGITLISGVEKTIERKHVLLLNFDAAAEKVDSFDRLAEAAGDDVFPRRCGARPGCHLCRDSRGPGRDSHAAALTDRGGNPSCRSHARTPGDEAHSCRSATSGSTRVARRAGIRVYSALRLIHPAHTGRPGQLSNP